MNSTGLVAAIFENKIIEMNRFMSAALSFKMFVLFFIDIKQLIRNNLLVYFHDLQAFSLIVNIIYCGWDTYISNPTRVTYSA